MTTPQTTPTTTTSTTDPTRPTPPTDLADGVSTDPTRPTDGPSPATGSSRPSRRELLVLLGILVLAALTRLPGLAGRGRWNADQGDQMLAIHDLVANGVVPLLGPTASTGSFHHGPLFYWLMAPAALVSGSDPLVVALWLVLLGVAAVAAAWWLGRLTGGPGAAALTGVLAAVSSAGIENSTVIWNPGPVPLFAALAAIGTIRAHQTGRARWWLLAGAGAGAAMQLHALAAILLVPVAAAWLLDALRARGARRPLKPILLGGLGAGLVVATGAIPLLLHDLSHGFAETQALIAYVTDGLRGASAPGLGAGTPLPVRLMVVLLRALTWPFSGLITERPPVSLLVLVIVMGLWAAALRIRPAWPARWQVGAVAWSIVVLAVAVPALATVTPQLPNDHYHGFLDPMVLALTGAGLARLWAGGAGATAAQQNAAQTNAAPRIALRRVLACAAALVLVGASVLAWPPFPAYDEGYPAADAAATRIMGQIEGRPVALAEIPEFKTAEGIEFPLVRRGAAIAADQADAHYLVVECDPLFDEVVALACGGPAEQAWLTANSDAGLEPIDRFQAGPRRWISVYRFDRNAGGG